MCPFCMTMPAFDVTLDLHVAIQMGEHCMTDLGSETVPHLVNLFLMLVDVFSLVRVGHHQTVSRLVKVTHLHNRTPKT